METAQPTNSPERYAKRLAGSRGVRPGFENLEKLPQRFEVMMPTWASQTLHLGGDITFR